MTHRFWLLMSLLVSGWIVVGFGALGRPVQGTAAPVAQPAAGCPPIWLMVDPEQHFGHLNDVAARTPDDIWAVGWWAPGGSFDTTIMHWDGQAWQEVASPSPGAIYNTLQGVAVRAADDAWAVGYYDDGTTQRTLTLHWNGTEWKVVPSPSPHGVDAEITSVAILAADDAWAVGSSGAAGQSQTLILHWDGTAWQTVAGPNPGLLGSELRGISGVAANDLWAVGSTFEPNNVARSLALHWDGTTWQQVPSPQPGPQRNAFAAVSARAGNDVWAVGGYTDGAAVGRPLIAHWDGTTWTVVAAPGPIFLSDVDVRAADDAWAVGADTVYPQSRVLHWDGQTWQLMDSPNGDDNSDVLAGIVALAPDNAWAVGGYVRWGAYWQSLLHYTPWCPPTATPTSTPIPACTPGWRVVPPPAETPQALVGVAATGADTWAVGYTGPLTNSRATIARWDGRAWQPATLPPIPGPFGNALYGIAARTHNDAWAVGASRSDGQTLTLHWDGQGWQSVPAPSPGSLTNILRAVAMRAADDVWAVGATDTSAPEVALILHWNGQGWQMVPTPDTGTATSELYGVAISAADDAWAVGVLGDTGTGTFQALMLHWDGTAWRIVPLPGLAPNSILYGITALAANDVWAVGSEAQASTVTLHWNGQVWQRVPSPNVPGLANVLRQVAGSAANDVWAVGTAGNFYIQEPVLLHWDGGAWNQEPAPVGGQAAAVAVAAPRDVWTVGANGAAALTLHYGDGLPFSDLWPSDPFYPYIRCLVCQGIVTGYADGTFRPANNITRGQASKLIANSAGLADPVPSTTQTFADVPPGHPFWLFIERLAARGYISGYGCGAANEPCDPQNHPYFRPSALINRGQLSKVVANTALYQEGIPSDQQTFADVPPSHPFWLFVERIRQHGVISGYNCGGPGEPCLPPLNRPYFRPVANATRGQTAKIGANAFFPACPLGVVRP